MHRSVHVYKRKSFGKRDSQLRQQLSNGGVSANDLTGFYEWSGGIAIPNPDTIAEFKVLTAQYDASYGRNAGATVNLVTKTGSNEFHGSLFEFFRRTSASVSSKDSSITFRELPFALQGELQSRFGTGPTSL